MVKKPFEEYEIGEIITIRYYRYEVVKKEIVSHFNKLAGQTFVSKRLYLRALDSAENRVARVRESGAIEFEWKYGFQYKKHRAEKRVYETW